ncbi:MAG: hypothetical protein AAF330_05585 [Pseudomonadota bacterium]
MCLTASALAAFMTLIGVANVSLGEDHITIHATNGDVGWTNTGAVWCTEAPRIDAKVRLKPAPLSGSH